MVRIYTFTMDGLLSLEGQCVARIFLVVLLTTEVGIAWVVFSLDKLCEYLGMLERSTLNNQEAASQSIYLALGELKMINITESSEYFSQDK